MVLETKELVGGVALIVFGVLCIVFTSLLSWLVGLALIVFGITDLLPRKK